MTQNNWWTCEVHVPEPLWKWSLWFSLVEFGHQVKDRQKSDEGSSSKRRRSFQVRLVIKYLCNNQWQEDDSGKKSKKSPYVSPGKGKACPECNKEFRNQGVLDRSSMLLTVQKQKSKLTFQAFWGPSPTWRIPLPGWWEHLWKGFHFKEQDEQPLFKVIWKEISDLKLTFFHFQELQPK